MSNSRDAEDEVSLLSLEAGHVFHVVNFRRATFLATRLRLALDPWRRLRGLLFAPPLREGEGMLLRPCNSVHTCFMAYPIDVLFLDERGEVVGLRHLRPWRFSPIYSAAVATLELPEGGVAASGTQVGDRIAFLREGC